MKKSTIIIFSSILIALSGLFPATSTAGVSSFAFHVGGNGFGISVGAHDWGVHGGWWSGGTTLSTTAALSGYGEWLHVGGLGRVWRPHVAAGWRPYTHGRWLYTEVGWTWVAYEPWGYIPHHYGEWALTGYGWAWVPGYVYRPAHVVWVSSGGCVGWYARPPRGWSHARRAYHRGAHNGYHRGYGNGYADGRRDAMHATYVPWKHMGAENISRHTLSHAATGGGRHAEARAMTRAPSPTEVSRHGGGAVQRAALERRTVTADGRRTTLARPTGIRRSVERHAGATVERALAPAARRQLSRSSKGPAHTQRREPISPARVAKPESARRSASTPPSAHARRQETVASSRRRPAGEGPRGTTVDRRPQVDVGGQRGDASNANRPAGSRKTTARRSPVSTRAEQQSIRRPSHAGSTRTVASTRSSRRAEAKQAGRSAPASRAEPTSRGDRRQRAAATDRKSGRPRR